MRQWRVGTVTLGLTLFLMGCGLLYAHVNKIVVVDLLFTWWPILFVLLGIEVLASQVVTRNGQTVLKYDIIAMFLVFLVVSGGMILQVVNETGLSERIKQEVSIQSLYMNTEWLRCNVEPGVKRVVIEAPFNGVGLNVRTTAEAVVTASGKARLHVDSESAAREMLQNSFKMNQNQVGDILFINFDTISKDGIGYNLHMQSISLLVPENVAVELNTGNADVAIIASEKSDWFVKTEAGVKVDIPAGTNLLIKASVWDSAGPGGNIDWDIKDSSEQQQALDGQSESSLSLPVTASYQTGTPQHLLNIEAYSLQANIR